MKRWILPLAWSLLALAHASFFWSLCSGMSGLDISVAVRGLGLLGAIAYCLVEATGRGLLNAQVISDPRRLLAFWVAIAALHAGVPLRYAESPGAWTHQGSHGALVMLMGAMGMAVATGTAQATGLASGGMLRRAILPHAGFSKRRLVRPLVVFVERWDAHYAQGGRARETCWLLARQQLSPPAC